MEEIILFHRLDRAHMSAIVDIQIARLVQRLNDRKISLELDDAARAWLGDAGYDSAYGARPLKRIIQRNLQNPLAQLIIAGRLDDGETVRVSAGPDGLVIDGQDSAALASAA